MKVEISLSRRHFLQLSAAATVVSALPMPLQAKEGQVALPIPPLLESRRGQPLFLTLQKTQWNFIPLQKAQAWGINGQYLGPTVRVKSGDNLKLVYSNHLSEAVAIGVSGLSIPGALAGGPGRIIAPGKEWAPVIPIEQRAATCWYHACTPGKMASHIYQGLAGIWLVDDPVSHKLPLPNYYGVDDIPLILQDKVLNREGEPSYTQPGQGGFLGEQLLVNGVINPVLEVSRGWIRLRLLNASNSRHYKLRLGEQHPFYLIANDQGLLAAPVMVQQLSLAPGERREILLDMTPGKELILNAGEPAGIVQRLRSLFETSDTLLNTNVLTLMPTGMAPLISATLPARLLIQQPAKGVAVQTREFILGGAVPGINGRLWDQNRIDVQAKLGSWERWIIRADMPQSFHIQGVSFQITRVNGVAPLAEDQGWKDTTWIDGEVELLVYFMQATSPGFLFQFYSQSLEMADRGSAGQLAVVA